MVSSTPRPHFTPRKVPVPILQEAGFAQGSVWRGGGISSPPGFDPGPSIPQSVAIPTELPGPHNYKMVSINLQRTYRVWVCEHGLHIRDRIVYSIFSTSLALGRIERQSQYCMHTSTAIHAHLGLTASELFISLTYIYIYIYIYTANSKRCHQLQ